MSDDDFDSIVEGLEIIDDQKPRNYTDLNDATLLFYFHRVKKDLTDRNVLVNPITEEDIDKQARYYGMLQEMTKRGLR